ncbi:hypothetical protein Q3C01_05065 [Bradyrhizobium sp. UFLA05-109]
MMRRVDGIVNEMEFRMLRAAQSFSPPVRASTTKRFLRVRRDLLVVTHLMTMPSLAQSSRISADAHIAFSQASVQ